MFGDHVAGEGAIGGIVSLGCMARGIMLGGGVAQDGVSRNSACKGGLD